MQTYTYYARDAELRMHVDTIQKEREAEVYAFLDSLNLKPVDVIPVANEQAAWRIKYRKEKIILFNELATYKKAGNITAREMANDILSIFPKGTAWYTIVSGFLEDISKNRKLYQAMAERPKIFAQHEIEL